MFQAAIQNYSDHEESCCLKVNSYIPKRVINKYLVCYNVIDSLSDYRDQWREPDGSMTLSTMYGLLHDHRHRLCSDDRDKIFGLLGLVTNWLGIGPIQADYELDVRTLYEQVILSDIKGTNSLRALVGDLEKYRHPELASWVTDWTNPAIESDWHQPSRRRACVSYVDYKATGSKDLEMKIHPCSILCLAGSRIDRVSAIGDQKTYGETVEMRQKCFVLWYLFAGLDKDPHRAYCCGGTWTEAFWRTMCGDFIYTRSGRRRVNPEIDEAVYISWCTSYIGSPFHPDGLTPEQRAPYVSDARFAKLRHQWSESESHEGNSIDFAMNANLPRTLFITESGLIGMGPSSMTVGDEVYVLFGGNLPFILSDSGKQAVLEPGQAPQKLYYLRGDAYVHGIMDGETVDSDSVEGEKVYLI